VVLGGILMFALVLMLLVLFQVTLVPSLNEASEFDHSERVQKDMEAVQADLLSASATGAPEELTVETGLRYPERAFLVNPPPVAGSMTTAPGSVTLEGFFSDDIEVDDFWTGTNSRTYESQLLTYAPAYNEFDNAPTIHYEHSTLYNGFDNGAIVPIGNGKLISGDRINLVLLEGDLSEASTRSITTRIDPVSAPARTTQLQAPNQDGNPTITFTTGLSTEQWREILESELDENGGNVVSVTAGPAGSDTVTIALNNTVVYEVRMTKIGIGSGYGATQRPAYVRTAVGNGTELRTNETQEIVFEVLDEFNNPVSGVDVTASASTADGSLVPVQPTTDLHGRATFEYTAGGTRDVVDVTGTYDAGSTNTGTATATVVVATPDDDQESDENVINPVGDTIVLIDAERVKEDSVHKVRLELENALGSTVAVESVRVNFYFQGKPGTGTEPPIGFDLTDSNGVPIVTNGDIGGDFSPVENALQFEESPPTTTLKLTFLTSKEPKEAYSPPNSDDDFFVLTLRFDDGSTRVYFVPSTS